jgi:L-threonylcarbamoyladenylate synthase
MVESSVLQAVECILNGGIVAFPTETYYGLAVDPDNESALKDLFILKQRESEKAILVLIENSKKIYSVAAAVPEEFKPLMEKFWPGPLTLVFPAKNTLSPLLTGQSNTVGVRVSPHPIAGALVRAVGKPVTATSANISGQKPAKSAKEVKKIFGNRVDFIIDGGETAAGLCSTLVGLENGVLTIFREGQTDLRTEL